jgi:energy-coupling factor transporter ATP-binding protein EcfA2
LKGEAVDFYQIKQRSTKSGTLEIYPDFKITRSRDLMVRGKSFYAIWDEEKGLWSTDEYDVQRLVDNELMEERNRILGNTDGVIHVKFMSDFSTNAWSRYRTYLAQISDNAHQLDENLTFANSKVKKSDYVSRRLPYSLEGGKTEAYDKLMSTLYSPEERKKLEWAIGSIVAGEGKVIQKFIVLYGEGGSGKSTFLNILQKLFDGYYTTFEAKALTSASNLFSTEVFRNNPLVAIQHDGDLSRIEDNTKLNSIVAHEVMTMNEKYKPSYTARANCFLFMATNKPVRITDAKSGVIRRLIDVKPSGKKIPTNEYFSLMSRIDFELGAIAQKCLDIYRSMGKNYYSTYRPLGMILQTDVFFNFVETHYYTFLQQGGVSLTQAWAMYKEFCEESLIDFKLPRYKFRDELRNYFKDFLPVTRIDGKQVRSYYADLITEKFKDKEKDIEESSPSWLSMDVDSSIFDGIAKDYLAQYASEKYETPSKKWKDVKTTLKDLDTQKLHYVQVPEEHIVIDFDIRDSDGKKSPELNLKAATEFPPTYAEFSKSQCGIHLHYIYDGDVSTLSHVYSEGIEVKVFPGDSALRRKLSKCNSIPISIISGGLPTRPKKMINFDAVQSEKGIRELIKRNLRKEIHPGTKPSIDFIYKILEDAYESDLHYDIRDMRPTILAFAMNSTNQANYCVKVVSKMHFHSEEPSIAVASYPDDRLAFFDVEVFPNLFLVNWKYEGEDNECIHMINPTPQDVEELLKLRLIGFNCRRYDNHILYARYIGYDNEMIYNLSKKIIEGYRRILFGEAYNVSYADVYDFSSKKQSLKKFQIELGIHHLELGFPFDEPIPEEKWPLVIEYCDNDVISTEAVFHARKQDFVARQILAAISGLTVNDSTQSHATKIIFGDNRAPQDEFVYTDLSEEFAGYEFNFGKSSYCDEDPGEGGYVYAEPGYYEDVALLDIASMHPTSILTLNLFGSYTEKYRELVESRLAIKQKDFDTVIKKFGGVFEQFVTSVDDADDLAYALKIVINIVYGLTSAKFSNPFRDNRNVDNIVAKRGALFMIDLKHAVQEQGYTVAHIKTDSIKIPKATKKIIDFVVKFGKKYGYDFEHETTFEKFCLVNDAVYVGRKSDGTWTATGAEFQHPYIFKSLFSKEPIVFEDMCETKTVTTALYLDMNEALPEDEHAYMFIGRAGSFCPIKPGANGGILLREKEGKYYAASGTKGWRWLQSAMVKELKKEEDIDLEYFRLLVDKAVDHIREFVDFEVLTF